MPNAEWKAKNPERLREQQRKWREENREKVRAQQRAYHARNKDTIVARNKTRPPAEGKPDTHACRKCETVLPFTEEHFTPRDCNKFKLDYQCRNCRSAEALNRAVMSKYGMTQEEAKALRATRVCAICGGEDRLHIDHCHTTGRVRGVLCSACNTAIGLLKEDPERIRLAAFYCEAHG